MEKRRMEEREREREREREKKASNGVLIHTLEDKMTLVEWLSRRLFWHKNTCTKEQNMTRWWDTWPLITPKEPNFCQCTINKLTCRMVPL